MYLRLNRQGRVQTTKTADNQCRQSGHMLYDYRVQITVLDSNLDVNKFIVDHVRIHEFIVAYFATRISSCEVICRDVATALDKKLLAAGVTCLDMYIRITPVSNEVGPNRSFMEWSKTGKF